MAGSFQPRPLTPPVDTCRVPPRTPGPLGVNDQGDPNVTTLIGDTPSSVGMLDGADPTLPLFSSAGPNAGLVCKAADGVPLAIGFDFQASMPATNQAPEYISLKDAQEIALEITTYFEGGKSMNYQALADDFDGQGTSFGLIQWNFGSNTLGPLLKKMLDQNGTAFKGCFGDHADYETLKTALTEGNKDNQLKWARDRIKNKRSAWESAFKNIGLVEGFNKIQREEAANQYHPWVVKVITKLREVSSTLFAKIEVRTYAAIFDMCVQQVGDDKSMTKFTGKTADRIMVRVTNEKPTSQLQLMKTVVTETANTASNKWVSDCLSRRMGILTGASYKSKEHDVTAERKNTQLSLISQSGDKYVSCL